MWLYSFAKFAVGVVYRTAYRVEVLGLENIPAEGGFILCANHFHANDPIIVGITLPRPIRYMAKQELFKNPFLSFIIRGMGVFPVKRGQPDRVAIKTALEIVEKGGALGVFPEGTRNKTGVLAKAEPGSAWLALKSGAPVVPAGISSRYKLFGKVVIRYGTPVNLDRFREGKLSQEALEEAGAAIMTAIGERLVPTGS